MIITLRERIYRTICTGGGGRGGMSTGGGIEKRGSCMIRSINPQKGILGGGMGYRIIEICLRIT